ncbi:MAG: Cadmium-induced protein CadI [Gammaproteobacteria bacterium]|nr:Cadmium-induced protein CadI [Gammaproteobacteria bacterium]
MKRMHIHVGVDSIPEAVRFYSALFGAGPTKVQPDYAKWMLDDPRVNFAVSTRVSTRGVDHLGIQVEEDSELQDLRARLRAADMTTFDEGETVCCYARSEKSWLEDPAGLAWEAYRTMEDAQVFHARDQAGSDAIACCAPTPAGPKTAGGTLDTPVRPAGCCG